MNQEKPFLIKFSREPRKQIPEDKAVQIHTNTEKPHLRATMVTDVRRETSDDK